MAFERIEPFGSQMENFRAGQICATVVNCNGGKKGKPVSAADFMPLFNPEKDNPNLSNREKQKKQIAMFSSLAGTGPNE